MMCTYYMMCTILHMVYNVYTYCICYTYSIYATHTVYMLHIQYTCYTYCIHATHIHILNLYSHHTLTSIPYPNPPLPGPCPGPVLRPVDPGPIHETGGGQRGLVALLPQRSQGPCWRIRTGVWRFIREVWEGRQGSQIIPCSRIMVCYYFVAGGDW